MTINMYKFLDLYQSMYRYLYDNDVDCSEYAAAFDEAMKIENFSQLVKEFSKFICDLVCSDRERAAYALAFDTYVAMENLKKNGIAVL